MNPDSNVVKLPGVVPDAEQAPYIPPKHFKAAQRAAWADLVDSADAAMRTRENRFAFEIAATLVAKFRSGKAMNATETKEMKKQLVGLGLARPDDGAGPGRPRKNAKYFGE